MKNQKGTSVPAFHTSVPGIHRRNYLVGILWIDVVRVKGLEPPSLSAAGPKPAVSTSSTTRASGAPLQPLDTRRKTVPESVPGVPVLCPGTLGLWPNLVMKSTRH